MENSLSRNYSISRSGKFKRRTSQRTSIIVNQTCINDGKNESLMICNEIKNPEVNKSNDLI